MSNYNFQLTYIAERLGLHRLVFTNPTSGRWSIRKGSWTMRGPKKFANRRGLSIGLSVGEELTVDLKGPWQAVSITPPGERFWLMPKGAPTTSGGTCSTCNGTKQVPGALGVGVMWPCRDCEDA